MKIDSYHLGKWEIGKYDFEWKEGEEEKDFLENNGFYSFTSFSRGFEYSTPTISFHAAKDDNETFPTGCLCDLNPMTDSLNYFVIENGVSLLHFLKEYDDVFLCKSEFIEIKHGLGNEYIRKSTIESLRYLNQDKDESLIAFHGDDSTELSFYGDIDPFLNYHFHDIT